MKGLRLCELYFVAVRVFLFVYERPHVVFNLFKRPIIRNSAYGSAVIAKV